MKILILNGSPRKKGNTAKLVQAFTEGAEEKGHTVVCIPVASKKIAGCLACEHCHTKGNGQCVQKDDMQEVYTHLSDAQMLVLASPVYYHDFSAQLKCAIDRLYACAYPAKPPMLEKMALIMSSMSPNVFDGAIYVYKKNFVEYLGLQDMGIFTIPGEHAGTMEALPKLRAFGASV